MDGAMVQVLIRSGLDVSTFFIVSIFLVRYNSNKVIASS